MPYAGDMEEAAAMVETYLGEPSAAGLPAGLSKRDAEVLRISLNTVDRHVSNIVTKISAANRAEAASFAVRHGLAQ